MLIAENSDRTAKTQRLESAIAVTARLVGAQCLALMQKMFLLWQLELSHDAVSGELASFEEHLVGVLEQRRTLVFFARRLSDTTQAAVLVLYSFLKWRIQCASRHGQDDSRIPSLQAANVVIQKVQAVVALSRTFFHWRGFLCNGLVERGVVAQTGPLRDIWLSRARTVSQRLALCRSGAVAKLAFGAWSSSAREGLFVVDVAVLQQQVFRQENVFRDRTLNAVTREEVRFEVALAQFALWAWRQHLLVQDSVRTRQRLLRAQARQCEVARSAAGRLVHCHNIVSLQRVLHAWGQASGPRFARFSPERRRASREPVAAARLLQRLRLASDLRAGARVFGAWQRHLVQVACDRSVQIAELERDELLRRLYSTPDSRDRSNRNTLATVERSMSAALLARALEF